MIRTRFAPSPTGYLHIGGLRTAAYAYALAKHSSGEFLLRIEDTDQKREIKGATQKIFDVLEKFMNWDGVVIQSDRAKAGVYRDAALKLVNSGHAFYCQCQPRNAKEQGFSTTLRDPCRDQHNTTGAVKLRIPDNETLTYNDFVLKHEVSWNSNDVPDTILLKSDRLFATYHLAVAVDDNFQKITHVLRGPEWISSVPVHLLVHRYLGYKWPEVGHPTSILDPAGGKLSKRKGNSSVEQFLADGYLPEALLNFVILLGWAPKDNRELFTLDEFVKAFDINGFQKSNPALNLQKLDWFNAHYIRQKSDSELVQLITPYFNHPKLDEIIPLIKDRITKLSDVPSLTSFFTSNPPIPPDPSLSPDHLRFAINNYDRLIKGELIDNIKSKGWKVGDFFMSLRIAICGSRSTPPITETMLILGKDESINRIKTAFHEY
ncbi:MAG: Glutamate--tRNA ligase [Microgenomates group bacterium Gr01-1014_16]|nr:MAG: Glutamate--tRNA ligase [Microgenomates group bacterium Gr01-1014_16]